MARMHSRKKGKSGSAKPVRSQKPKWVDYKKEEVEELVVKLGNEGHNSSIVGMIMRDQNGVPNVKLVTGKRITKVLEEKNIKKSIPEDLNNLIIRAVSMDKHLKINPKDRSSKRGMQLTESKIRRLVKYYKKVNKLPGDWKYNIKTAKLLVK